MRAMPQALNCHSTSFVVADAILALFATLEGEGTSRSELFRRALANYHTPFLDASHTRFWVITVNVRKSDKPFLELFKQFGFCSRSEFIRHIMAIYLEHLSRVLSPTVLNRVKTYSKFVYSGKKKTGERGSSNGYTLITVNVGWRVLQMAYALEDLEQVPTRSEFFRQAINYFRGTDFFFSPLTTFRITSVNVSLDLLQQHRALGFTSRGEMIRNLMVIYSQSVQNTTTSNLACSSSGLPPLPSAACAPGRAISAPKKVWSGNLENDEWDRDNLRANVS